MFDERSVIDGASQWIFISAMGFLRFLFILSAYIHSTFPLSFDIIRKIWGIRADAGRVENDSISNSIWSESRERHTHTAAAVKTEKILKRIILRFSIVMVNWQFSLSSFPLASPRSPPSARWKFSYYRHHRSFHCYVLWGYMLLCVVCVDIFSLLVLGFSLSLPSSYLLPYFYLFSLHYFVSLFYMLIRLLVSFLSIDLKLLLLLFSLLLSCLTRLIYNFDTSTHYTKLWAIFSDGFCCCLSATSGCDAKEESSPLEEDGTMMP